VEELQDRYIPKQETRRNVDTKPGRLNREKKQIGQRTKQVGTMNQLSGNEMGGARQLTGEEYKTSHVLTMNQPKHKHRTDWECQSSVTNQKITHTEVTEPLQI